MVQILNSKNSLLIARLNVCHGPSPFFIEQFFVALTIWVMSSVSAS